MRKIVRRSISRICQQVPKRSGRSFILAVTIATMTISLGLGAVLGFSRDQATTGFVPEAYAQEFSTADDYYKKSIEYMEQGNENQAKSVFDEGVRMDMSKSSVDDILESCYTTGLVRKVNKVGDKTDFKEKVYGSNKPSLVFYYISSNYGDFDKREAILVKNLAMKYNEKLNVVVYDVLINPNRDFSLNEVKGEGITDSPSLEIYSKFDLVKGETPTNNNGRIKGVDILWGGPSQNEKIWSKFSDCVYYWIDQNLFFIPNPDGDGKVYKHNNSYKLTEVKNVFVR